jgi:hypothetical protein
MQENWVSPWLTKVSFFDYRSQPVKISVWKVKKLCERVDSYDNTINHQSISAGLSYGLESIHSDCVSEFFSHACSQFDSHSANTLFLVGLQRGAFVLSPVLWMLLK